MESELAKAIAQAREDAIVYFFSKTKETMDPSKGKWAYFQGCVYEFLWDGNPVFRVSLVPHGHRPIVSVVTEHFV